MDDKYKTYLSTRKLNCRILAKTKELFKDEWLDVRKLGIGGSDISAIAGVNKYSSAIEVWADKTNVIETKCIDNEAMFWGRTLEDVIAKEYSNRTGNKVERAEYVFQHKVHDYMLGNLDRLVFDPTRGYGILECKNTSIYMEDQWESQEFEKVPDMYHLQGQWYLGVTGLAFVDYAVLIGGNKLVIKQHNREDDTIESVQQIATEFWHKNVINKEPPDPDGSDSARDTVKEMYINYIEHGADLSEIRVIFQKYNILNERIKLNTVSKKECYNLILKALGNHKIGVIDGEKVASVFVKKTGIKQMKINYKGA